MIKLEEIELQKLLESNQRREALENELKREERIQSDLLDLICTYHKIEKAQILGIENGHIKLKPTEK